jgi:hypothetical protein
MRWAVLFLPGLIAACANDHQSSFASSRDSAGIQITESSRPLWTEAGAWVIDAMPTIRIGGEVEDTVPLVGVVRARVMPMGGWLSQMAAEGSTKC